MDAWNENGEWEKAIKDWLEIQIGKRLIQIHPPTTGLYITFEYENEPFTPLPYKRFCARYNGEDVYGIEEVQHGRIGT
ncbi:MAG: hypothetical protein MN733_18695 [Nitrososphaera sp.]|nr:hypothetical protein [Nitrososphaera sp.]